MRMRVASHWGTCNGRYDEARSVLRYAPALPTPAWAHGEAHAGLDPPFQSAVLGASGGSEVQPGSAGLQKRTKDTVRQLVMSTASGRNLALPGRQPQKPDANREHEASPREVV